MESHEIYGMLGPQHGAVCSEGIDTSMKHFTVGRAEKTVSVRGAELEFLGDRWRSSRRRGDGK